MGEEGASESAAPRGTSAAIRCRQIRADDLDAVIRLLGRGFPDRPDLYWRRGLARHLARAVPPGFPRYGYLLEADGEPVGVLLTLYTEQDFRPDGGVRCNLSSWYVDPRYRPQAALLDRVALRREDVTYLNVTPAPHTWVLQETNGFVRHVRGQVLAIPALRLPAPGVVIRAVAAGDSLAELDPRERILLEDHLSYGCLGFVWTDGAAGGPLVVQKRWIGLAGLLPRIKLPCFHVVYCRSAEDLTRIAGPLGRLMLRRHAMPLLLVDAKGPIPGLAGHFFADRSVKFTRGPSPVEPGDLAYTEIVLFGP